MILERYFSHKKVNHKTKVLNFSATQGPPHTVKKCVAYTFQKISTRDGPLPYLLTFSAILIVTTLEQFDKEMSRLHCIDDTGYLHNLKHGKNAAQCLGLKQSKASIRMYKCFISSHYWPLSFAYLIVYVLKIANVYVKICIFVFFMCKISYFVSFYVFCQSIFITKKTFQADDNSLVSYGSSIFPNGQSTLLHRNREL